MRVRARDELERERAREREREREQEYPEWMGGWVREGGRKGKNLKSAHMPLAILDMNASPLPAPPAPCAVPGGGAPPGPPPVAAAGALRPPPPPAPPAARLRRMRSVYSRPLDMLHCRSLSLSLSLSLSVCHTHTHKFSLSFSLALSHLRDAPVGRHRHQRLRRRQVPAPVRPDHLPRPSPRSVRLAPTPCANTRVSARPQGGFMGPTASMRLFSLYEAR
jgi:hypothetical protein